MSLVLAGEGATMAARVARRLRVRGRVQGVGFRPYVHRLAAQEALAGWVRNDGQGVEIVIEGDADALARFADRLPREAPPRARVDAMDACATESDASLHGFEIRASWRGDIRTEVATDTAVCADCLAEMLDPGNRRYRYPFISCTQCGPRYTITRELPYDRCNTSMAGFVQCVACAAEYGDRGDRRFHAEANACADCGPRLELRSADAQATGDDDVLAATLARLRRGEIVAMKGLGGFHLACDARNRAAVARLRDRKAREEKPLAIMVADLASLSGLAELDGDSRCLLESAERPIVLLPKAPGCDAQLPGVAPGVAWLGVMLPYTPIQALLFHDAALPGRCGGEALLLVMTSANPCGEPLVRDNVEALERLGAIADAFVLHDRDIVARCDDSVLRAASEAAQAGGQTLPSFIRRARGYTPQSIAFATDGPAVLALGPLLKNTVCISDGKHAFVSAHIGDLDKAAACEAQVDAVEHLLSLTGIRPQRVAHDLHPDFFSTRLAAQFAAQRGLPLVGVQHHHAHIAAVMAEHGVETPVLGLALDGVGLGSDGAAWGGELLCVSPAGCERIAHLRELPLPGGDKAAREPWRMAAAALFALGRGEEVATRWPHVPAARALPMMLKAGAHCPPTSSAGRWFDAAAALAGVREFAAYEGQAAMLYEGLAAGFIARHGAPVPVGEGYVFDADGNLDLLPLLERLACERDGGRAAALFHVTVAQALSEWAQRAARARGIGQVVLGGGCFLNAVLAGRVVAGLARRGIEALEARRVPPNDGGISLGQAWVARHVALN